MKPTIKEALHLLQMVDDRPEFLRKLKKFHEETVLQDLLSSEPGNLEDPVLRLRIGLSEYPEPEVTAYPDLAIDPWAKIWELIGYLEPKGIHPELRREYFPEEICSPIAKCRVLKPALFWFKSPIYPEQVCTEMASRCYRAAGPRGLIRFRTANPELARSFVIVAAGAHQVIREDRRAFILDCRDDSPDIGLGWYDMSFGPKTRFLAFKK